VAEVQQPRCQGSPENCWHKQEKIAAIRSLRRRAERNFFALTARSLARSLSLSVTSERLGRLAVYCM